MAKKGKPDECRVCKIDLKFGTKASTLICNDCEEAFHASCVGLSEDFVEYYIKESQCPWFCAPCYLKKIPDSNSIAEALKQTEDKIKEELAGAEHRICKKVSEITKTMLGNSEQKMMLIINKTEEKMQSVIEQTNKNYNDLERRIKKLEQAPSGVSQPCNCDKRVEYIEKKNNVVITNIPYTEKEYLKDVVVKIANTCDVHARHRSRFQDKTERVPNEHPVGK